MVSLQDVTGWPWSFAKMEGENVTGSMKMRSARFILEESQLPWGSTVIESTSGNMGTALAFCCQKMGLNCVLVVDPKLSPWHREMMLLNGARLVEVTQVDETGGWLKTRLATVQRLLEEHKDWFWVNQYSNSLNPFAFMELGNEIEEQLDYKLKKAGRILLFMAVSTGGSLTGVARILKRSFADRKPVAVYAVDAYGSVIFGGPSAKRYLNGIGSSLENPPNLDRSLVDASIIVHDEEAFAWCYELRKSGIYAGGSSGAVVAAIHKLRPQFVEGDLVIAVFPDCGDIYADTLYSTSWLKERGLVLPEVHVVWKGLPCVG